MDDIKKLREASGAGMMDCKKALAEAGGDMEKAAEILRKNGIAKAAKRSEREASEGIIKLAVSDDKNTGFIVEINAETDFVVRSERFQEFAEKIIALIKAERIENREKLMASSLDGDTVQNVLKNLSGVIGEKLDISRMEKIETKGTIAAYSHMGGKIGAIVAVDKEGEDKLAYDMAMQVAAANPKYINPEDVEPKEIEKEKDIYKEQLLKTGKPENIIEKIIIGKLNKYYEEVCLVKQEYIKDDKQKVENILGDIKVEKFFRFSLS